MRHFCMYIYIRLKSKQNFPFRTNNAHPKIQRACIQFQKQVEKPSFDLMIRLSKRLTKHYIACCYFPWLSQKRKVRVCCPRESR